MKRIEEINNPKFIKKLNINEMIELSSDLREFILNNISKTGGHLSSNLGIVDLTIAMLKVFEPTKDIIIFDVGHQCYPYKILTGRAKEFNSLRKFNGLSGFQSIEESNYDKYEAGHSSTSISAGLGFSIARDLNKEKHNVISVIGDGSISNGLAYEALNHIGDLGAKQIIILNDNQMSISKNVGALHNLLDSIRAGKKYSDYKENTKTFLNKSKLGKFIFRNLEYIKNGFKQVYLNEGTLFDDFGIEYYGPINGHDYKELIKYLNIAKNQNGPVILHVITQKGKGYSFAENDIVGKFHGISSFDIDTGEVLKKEDLPSFSEIISSKVLDYCKRDKDIICITPGMSYGSKLDEIKEKIPNQFIDVGISEEHGLIIANSLALSKKKPIVFIYSTFLQRGYDMIVHDIARMNTGVIFCIDRCGLIPGDGVSHQGVFDIPFMMSIPNMVISMPKDSIEANDLIYTALNNNKPFVIRYPKVNLEDSNEVGKLLDIGSWEIIKEGKDGTIITYGEFVNASIDICKDLEKDNLDLRIVNARFIKPYDKKMFESIVKDNKPIFVYEESMKIGSLGNVLSMDIQKYGTKSKIEIFAIEDMFLTHGSRDDLLKLTKLDRDNVIKRIKKSLEK